ncbi:MAG: hypothetical protein MHMPM18_001884 [Marteilia pararefringens]
MAEESQDLCKDKTALPLRPQLKVRKCKNVRGRSKTSISARILTDICHLVLATA